MNDSSINHAGLNAAQSVFKASQEKYDHLTALVDGIVAYLKASGLESASARIAELEEKLRDDNEYLRGKLAKVVERDTSQCRSIMELTEKLSEERRAKKTILDMHAESTEAALAAIETLKAKLRTARAKAFEEAAQAALEEARKHDRGTNFYAEKGLPTLSKENERISSVCAALAFRFDALSKESGHE